MVLEISKSSKFSGTQKHVLEINPLGKRLVQKRATCQFIRRQDALRSCLPWQKCHSWNARTDKHLLDLFGPTQAFFKSAQHWSRSLRNVSIGRSGGGPRDNGKHVRLFALLPGTTKEAAFVGCLRLSFFARPGRLTFRERAAFFVSRDPSPAKTLEVTSLAC